MWQVYVHKDIVKGQFNVLYHAYVYWELFCVIARKKDKAYIHYMTFDNWDSANYLVERIKADATFSPENKPDLWSRAYDLKPVAPLKRRIWL